MLKKIISAFIAATFVLISSSLYASASTPIQSVNNIAAVVNKSVITEYQVQQASQNVKKHMMAAHVTPPDDEVIRQQVIQQLINEELQLQMAKRAKITVTDKELNKGIAGIAKSNNISVAELKQKVQQQGESYSSFKSDIRKQMLVSKVQHAAVAGKVNITDDAVNKLIAKYNRQQRAQKSYHLADILVSLPDDADKSQLANAKNRAEDIYKKLKKGGNFSKMAKLESNNAAGPSDGDLGWKTSDEIPDLFLTQLQHMKVGQISQPIQAGNGFHILKLLGVKNSDKTLSKEEARRIVGEKAYKKAVDKWLKGLRKSAYIKVNKS